MISRLSTSLTLALMLAGSPAHARVQPQSDDTRSTVSLDIDLSALPPGEYTTEYIDENLAAHQARVLSEGGIDVVDDADATIRIIISRYGEGDIHYRYSVALLEEGVEAPTVERTLACELCRESDLFVKVGEEVARMSGRLLYAPKSSQTTEEGSTEPPPEEDEPPPPRVRRVGGAGWAGIASAALGIAVGVGGVVELRRPPERLIRPRDDRQTMITQPRALGRALVGVGVGMVIAGAVLVIVDQTVLLDRRRDRARAATLVPVVTDSIAGVAWSGRF